MRAAGDDLERAKPDLTKLDYQFLVGIWVCRHRATSVDEERQLDKLFRAACERRSLDLHTVTQLLTVTVPVTS